MTNTYKIPPRMIIDIIKNHHVNRKDFIIIEYSQPDPSLGRDRGQIVGWKFTHDFTRHFVSGKNTFRPCEEIYKQISNLKINI